MQKARLRVKLLAAAKSTWDGWEFHTTSKSKISPRDFEVTIIHFECIYQSTFFSFGHVTFKKSLKQNNWKIFQKQLRKKTYQLGVPQQRWCHGRCFFPPPGSSSCTGTCRLLRPTRLGRLWVFLSEKCGEIVFKSI